MGALPGPAAAHIQYCAAPAHRAEASQAWAEKVAVAHRVRCQAAEGGSMKIAILTPWIKIGGISQFVLTLGEYLLDHKYDVTVVTLYEQGDQWERLAAVGVHAVHLPMRWRDGRVQHALRVSRYLARQQFDLVITNIGIANWAGYNCVDFLPDSMIALVVFHSHHPQVYQAAAVHSDAWNLAVAVNPQVQNTAAARMPEKQVRLIPHGVRSPTAAELARRVGWATPLRLLFVGRLEDRQKGVFLLPGILRNCLAQGLQITLTVVGDGSDRWQLEQRFAEAGVADRVELTGALSNDAVYT
ncbi:MAG: glycosyltransferase, partial [Chloroflexia bacterium]|nr:glycosyltransferase [Chloroflexia bacterium]